MILHRKSRVFTTRHDSLSANLILSPRVKSLSALTFMQNLEPIARLDAYTVSDLYT